MASAEPNGAAAPAPSDAPAMDAKARREARKARILSSGNDRLARITKTGRGKEAETLYSEPPRQTLGGSRPMSPTDANSSSFGASPLEQDQEMMFKRAQAAIQGRSGINNDEDADPGEVDISQGPAFLTSGPTGTQMQQDQMDMPQDMQGMIRMMQNAMMGAGGGPEQGSGGPDGASQQPFPFPFGSSRPGAAVLQEPVSKTASVLEAAFNMLRVAVFVFFGFALAYGALKGHAAAENIVPEYDSTVVEKFEHMTTLHRWARLAYERPAHWEARYFGVESFGLPIHGIPVFWLFITLEIALQSSRIMMIRSRPSPPSFLSKATAYIPNAHIRLLIRTLASYLPLLDGFINDLAVVVFTIGCTIMFAAWKVGLDPTLAAVGVHSGLQDAAVHSAASSVREKLIDMDGPLMGSIPPVQAAL